tara:strand:- start:56 stop:646 length:591 start_codon:yes stop_codon:yes gene_type:complete
MYKRLFDIFFSLFLLISLSPIILIIGLIIIIFDKHNPFFLQERSGKNGKQFHIYKFRSMKINTSNNQIKVTKIGKIIRITKFDEILQIINVFKNEMSIIGPRPLYPEFNNYFKKKHKLRLSVKPGITGLAQVKLRDSSNWNRKFNFDTIYVKKKSLKIDFYIFIQTFMIVIKSIINRRERPIEITDYKESFFKNYK